MEKQGEIKEYAKIRVGRYREILIAAGITALIARLFYQSVKALLLFFPVCYFYRRYSAKKEQEKRKRQLLQEFRDCMEMIEGNLLAGYALENAFLVAGKEMKELHGEGGLRQTELEIINRKVCMNQPLEIVFEEFAQRCGVEEIQNFSEVLSFAKRSGGNLVGIIQNTVRNISSKIQIEEEIQTMIAQKKLEQKVMNVMPLFLLFYLDITSPGYLNVLYHNVLGVIFMTICLLGYIASVLLSERMGRIEV